MTRQTSIFILALCLLFISRFSLAQQPIFATIAGGNLYSLDVKNCTSRFIGATGYGFGDLAFTPDGRLWGIVSGQIYQIDTTTANTTLIGNTGLPAVSLVGLNDSTLLAEASMNLYGINTTNASTYLIGTIGYSASGDLTLYDNDLYMTSGGLIKIVLNATYTSILSVTSLNNPIPICEGVVTASFAGFDNSIIGFSGPDAYKFCQIDGTYQLLCPSLLLGGTPGAASIKLPVQQPEPTSCQGQMTNINLTLFNNNYPLNIYPNPTNDQFFIETNTTDKLNVDLFDINGRHVFSKIVSDKSVVDVKNLNEGIYTLKIKTENEIINKKLVIVR